MRKKWYRAYRLARILVRLETRDNKTDIKFLRGLLWRAYCRVHGRDRDDYYTYPLETRLIINSVIRG